MKKSEGNVHVLFPKTQTAVVEVKTKMNVADVLARARENGSYSANAVSRTHKPDSVSELEHAWKTSVGGYVVALTSMQRGQMKQILKACPPGTAVLVVANAAADWLGFVSVVKAEAGITLVPTEPQVGFLLKYVGTAIKLQVGKVKPKKKLAPVVTDVQLSANPAVAPSDKANLSEMLDILGK